MCGEIWKICILGKDLDTQSRFGSNGILYQGRQVWKGCYKECGLIVDHITKILFQVS